MRQSGRALRKLIRSVAAAGVSGGVAKREERFQHTSALIPGAVEGYWDRLLMDPGGGPPGGRGRDIKAPQRLTHADSRLAIQAKDLTNQSSRHI